MERIRPALATGSALILSLLFLSAGIWKVTDLVGWSATLSHLKVPSSLALAGALSLGIAETWTGVLLLLPRHRRWGAWLAAAMLVFFMLYMGWFYAELRGKDCSCFPGIQRAVGPGFFAGDLLMLALAAVAAFWAKRSVHVRSAALLLVATVAFAAISQGIVAMRTSGLRVPSSVVADGRPVPLTHGKVLLFFYDPECLHCDEAAKRLSTHTWKNTTLLAVPTRMPQFAAGFLKATRLPAATSNSLDLLKTTFPFVDPPFAVALDGGRLAANLPLFDKQEPETTLRKLGFIQ